MFDKNVYKMTVVCCNYAVASYPPGNRRRAFHWRKYRRSAGDSCIANEPPENAQWNAPSVCRSWRYKQKHDWLGCTLFNLYVRCTSDKRMKNTDRNKCVQTGTKVMMWCQYLDYIQKDTLITIDGSNNGKDVVGSTDHGHWRHGQNEL